MTDEIATHQQLHEAMQFVWTKNPECAKVLKSFIDNQSKKLADMAEVIRICGNVARGLGEDLATAKTEIERLKKIDDAAERPRVDRSLTEYYRGSL